MQCAASIIFTSWSPILRVADMTCFPDWLTRAVNLVAITAVPIGPARTQLTVFPDDTARMKAIAKNADIQLDGPYPALVVQGDDEVGALADVHKQLQDANVNVFSSTGVADGRGGYGYVIYIRPEEFERAAEALNV